MIYNEFHPPLPRVSKRDIVAMKIWVPYGLSRDMKCGELDMLYDCAVVYTNHFILLQLL